MKRREFMLAVGGAAVWPLAARAQQPAKTWRIGMLETISPDLNAKNIEALKRGLRDLGYVSLIGAVLVMPTSLLTAPLGVRAAHAMSKRTLEMAFGCYLFIVGSRFVVSLL